MIVNDLFNTIEFDFITWKDFVAGWVSGNDYVFLYKNVYLIFFIIKSNRLFEGICSITVGYPLETIKVRQQTISTLQSPSHQAAMMLKHEGVS